MMELLFSPLAHIFHHGVAYAIGAGAVIYAIHRRRFNRRTPTGLQGFASFEHFVFIAGVERLLLWLARMVLGIALAGILSG